MDLEQLRVMALSFPGATEDLKWEKDLCFCVGGKMFMVTDLEANDGASVKMTPENFARFAETPGFAPAPYVGRFKWIHVSDANLCSREEWEHFISESYQMIRAKLPKKIRDSLPQLKKQSP